MARKKSDGGEPEQTDVEPSQEETAEVETTPETAPENTGDAAEQTDGTPVDTTSDAPGEQAPAGTSQEGAAAPDATKSRTEFVSGVRPGDQCICPDGRKGTVHKFDSGLVCIPNHDQSE